MKLKSSEKEDTVVILPNGRYNSVVKIPNGSLSRSSSLYNNINTKKEIPPETTGPDIYKKGACSPQKTTELPTVIPEVDGTNDASDTPVLVEAEGKLKNREIINMNPNVKLMNVNPNVNKPKKRTYKTMSHMNKNMSHQRYWPGRY